MLGGNLIVRPYRPPDEDAAGYDEGDLPAVSEIHRTMALPYPAPEWGKMLVSAVIEDRGTLHMAAFLRQTAETYLLVNPEVKTTRREKLGELLLLHKEMLRPAKKAGLEDVHCWIPPELGKRFGELLENPRFGWEPATWPCFHRAVR